MKITVHRGAGEIGGNCIELESSSGSRILLDYGAPLPKIDPLTHKSVETPLNEAELPVKGLYGKNCEGLAGLVISHIHRDHYGMLYGRRVNPTLPVYMSEIMEAMIKITGKLTPGKKHLEAMVRYFEKEHSFSAGAFKITPYLKWIIPLPSFSLFLLKPTAKK